MSLTAGAAPGPAAKSGQGKGAFGVKYIGEPGSSYSQPSGSAADVYETASRQEGGQGTFGPVGSDGKPATERYREEVPPPNSVGERPTERYREEVPPPNSVGERPTERYREEVPPPDSVGKRPQEAPVPKPSAPRDAVEAPAPGVRPTGVSVSAAAKEVSQQPEDRSRYSLWDGLTGPADLPDPKIKEADQAAKDSEAAPGAIQNSAPQAAVSPTGEQGRFLVEPFAVKGSEGKIGEIFVRFEIDLSKAGQSAEAKNAVAELGRVAGFRADARSEETMRDAVADRVSVRGWMPSDRIAAAMRLPGVAMLEIEPPAARPSYGPQAVTDILVGIRVAKGRGAPAGLGSGSDYAGVLNRLQSETGFELKKTIGYQEVPGGKDSVVVVSGRIPVRSISKALALNGIIKIASSPDASAPVPSTDQASRRGFLSFAFARSPLLVAATLIVLLSPLSLGLFRFLQFLVPYRKT
ncbi:MAG: hypothetical protein HZB91_10400 [Elusimicrobia bacterium]|nr:hypothetical protein [Elusimicrobiota bacterium]